MLFTVKSSFLKQKICLNDNLYICEGGVFCIVGFYSLLNFDKQFCDGFGMIIWCDHGIGGILNFARSGVSILIVHVIEEFKCCGVCKTNILVGYSFHILIVKG